MQSFDVCHSQRSLFFSQQKFSQKDAAVAHHFARITLFHARESREKSPVLASHCTS